MEIIQCPKIERAQKQQEAQELFFDTCVKIRKAWRAMGYSGDPIADIFISMIGVSIGGMIS